MTISQPNARHSHENNIDVRLSRLIAPSFYTVHRDVQAASHLHYWLFGGRGSGKSSFVSLELILGLMKHPKANAICFRRVMATLRDSVYAQLLWAIDKLAAARYWHAAKSPLRLVYLPTGQNILFRGLDEAKKIKSLKAEHGYFQYLWFEELDEFSGMAQLRSVCQSVLRGGEQFRCFYTYNPPRSAKSWVNAQALQPKAGRLYHHSDYRAMPRHWLGEEFFLEAERLREQDEILYRHEYLGEPVGTGQEVFLNLSLRAVSEQEIAGFDKLLRGLDFGYATDPLHYTVLYYDALRRRIVIFYEIHAYRLSNTQLARLINEELSRGGRGAVCCDSAEPKSIDDLYLCGVPAYAAQKGPGSVSWGLRFLAEELTEIVIDPVRCPHTAREFSGYELLPGSPLSMSCPDKDNHSIDAVRYALEREARARCGKKG